MNHYYNLIKLSEITILISSPYFATKKTHAFGAKALKHDWLRESEFGPSQIQSRRGAAWNAQSPERLMALSAEGLDANKNCFKR